MIVVKHVMAFFKYLQPVSTCWFQQAIFLCHKSGEYTSQSVVYLAEEKETTLSGDPVDSFALLVM